MGQCSEAYDIVWTESFLPNTRDRFKRIMCATCQKQKLQKRNDGFKLFKYAFTKCKVLRNAKDTILIFEFDCLRLFGCIQHRSRNKVLGIWHKIFYKGMELIRLRNSPNIEHLCWFRIWI